MVKVIDAGERQYELVEDWGQLPPGWVWGQVGAVGVDSKDRVHAFTRTEHPYMIFDRSGKLDRAWGEPKERRTTTCPRSWSICPARLGPSCLARAALRPFTGADEPVTSQPIGDQQGSPAGSGMRRRRW